MPERSACVEPNGRIRAPRPVARAGGRTIRADRPRGGQLLRAIRRHAVRNQRPRPPPPPRPRRSPRGVGGCARRWGSSFGAGGNHSIDPATAFSRNAWSRTAPSFARATVRASTWISASSWPASISKRSGRSAGFFVGTVDIPVARLGHIIELERRVGREKDRMFLATHAEAIRELTESDERFESKRPRSSRRRKPGIGRRRRPQ